MCIRFTPGSMRGSKRGDRPTRSKATSKQLAPGARHREELRNSTGCASTVGGRIPSGMYSAQISRAAAGNARSSVDLPEPQVCGSVKCYQKFIPSLQICLALGARRKRRSGTRSAALHNETIPVHYSNPFTIKGGLIRAREAITSESCKDERACHGIPE